MNSDKINAIADTLTNESGENSHLRKEKNTLTFCTVKDNTLMSINIHEGFLEKDIEYIRLHIGKIYREINTNGQSFYFPEKGIMIMINCPVAKSILSKEQAENNLV
ncbi:MAG: hypothetical protein D3909_02975 [Candidatus Electrothrix sp. ATG1]|nr:hypothetical protein [Candidatus Electrothrix sp. ATG1]MCI5209815.1 hypothetical protein [Candidatus Electrothrix sp. ATG2]